MFLCEIVPSTNKEDYISNSYLSHSAQVDEWIQATTVGLSSRELCEHFEFAISVLWFRSATIVSDVTVQAIFERTLSEAKEKFPCLGKIALSENMISLDECFAAEGNDPVEMVEAMRFVITEFLAILGNLTAEVLSLQLHATLRQIKSVKANKASDNLVKLNPSNKVKKK